MVLKLTDMVPYNLQLEISGRMVAISVELLDPLADEAGLIRYQIRSFHHQAIVFVNIEDDQLAPDTKAGFSDDATFTDDDIDIIAAAIRQYNSGRQLNFDQMTFNI